MVMITIMMMMMIRKKKREEEEEEAEEIYGMCSYRDEEDCYVVAAHIVAVVVREETLRVVKEEAGFVRFEIERRLAKSLRLHGGLVKGSESLVGNVVSGNFYSAQPFGVVDGVDYCWTGFPRNYILVIYSQPYSCCKDCVRKMFYRNR